MSCRLLPLIVTFGAAMMLDTSVKMLQTRYFRTDEEKVQGRYLAFIPSGAGANPSSQEAVFQMAGTASRRGE